MMMCSYSRPLGLVTPRRMAGTAIYSQQVPTMWVPAPKRRIHLQSRCIPLQSRHPALPLSRQEGELAIQEAVYRGLEAARASQLGQWVQRIRCQQNRRWALPSISRRSPQRITALNVRSFTLMWH
jgi:hypothetical protein